MGSEPVTAGTLSRRAFIARAAWIGAGTVVATELGRVLPFDGRAAARAVAGVREIALETREVAWELAPGKTIKAMAYNGRVPGPEIRVKEGERVRIVLTNALAEPTTIHWHGVDVPNAMDGCRASLRSPCSRARPSSTSSRRDRRARAGITRISRSTARWTWVWRRP